MDDPRPKMQDALKQAMISKDAPRRDLLRTTISAFKQMEVDKRRDVTADEAIEILQREIKRLRESVDEAQKAGRTDIAEEVGAQVAILEGFLPEQLTREQIEALVRDAIAESGASSAKEMGKVMGVLMPKVKGKADGKLVNEIVREQLNG